MNVKLALIALNFMNVSAKAAPLLSPVYRMKRTLHRTDYPRGSNAKRRENNQDRTEKESLERDVRPRALRQTRNPPRFVYLSMLLSVAPVETGS